MGVELVRRATRREMLRLAAAAGGAAVFPALGRFELLAETPECAETADQGGGPNYKAGAPERESLWEKGMPGRKLVVTGRVLDTRCRPVRDAVLDVWQSNNSGRYDFDAFVLRGRLHTNAKGEYRLVTIVPGRYGPPPHIHVKLNVPERPVVTTVINVVADPSRRDAGMNPRLIAALSDGPGGEKSAKFDFVVRLNS